MQMRDWGMVISDLNFNNTLVALVVSFIAVLASIYGVIRFIMEARIAPLEKQIFDNVKAIAELEVKHDKSREDHHEIQNQITGMASDIKHIVMTVDTLAKSLGENFKTLEQRVSESQNRLTKLETQKSCNECHI